MRKKIIIIFFLLSFLCSEALSKEIDLKDDEKFYPINTTEIKGDCITTMYMDENHIKNFFNAYKKDGRIDDKTLEAKPFFAVMKGERWFRPYCPRVLPREGQEILKIFDNVDEARKWTKLNIEPIVSEKDIFIYYYICMGWVIKR